MKQKLLAVILAAVAAVSCIACKDQSAAQEETKTASADAEEPEEESESVDDAPEFTVGISSPEQAGEYWSGDLDYLTGSLEEAGFSVVIQQAADEKEQAKQLKDMADQVSAVILIPVDSWALVDALDFYDENDIPVISYNQLVRDTDAVDYYVGFDSRAAGKAVGEFIEAQKNLKGAKEAGESYTMEFLLEDSGDLDSQFFYEGVRSVLEPYFEEGTLQSKSGRTQFTDLCLNASDAQSAKAKTSEILEQSYTEEPLDILCAQTDQILDGAVEAFQEENYSLYTTDKLWPLLTGQDASKSAIQRILTGTQGITVLKEYELLDDSCTDILESIRDDKDVEVNTSGKYDNGSRIVPAQLSDVQEIDRDNYKILADTGVYTEEQLESFSAEAE